MAVLAIIAEYNPFHYGHLYHLEQSKKATGADVTLCVMSGNFMQRGEPALVDKWLRAKMAVENGIDLVLELPFVFACNHAEYFAKGAVDLLSRLGCVDYLSFGSEDGKLTSLQNAAKDLTDEPPALSALISKYAGQGLSYPRARAQAMEAFAGREAAEVLRSPNNILAIEYLKQLKLMDSNIRPLTVKRYGTGYHDYQFSGNIGSATAIRHALAEGKKLDQLADFLPAPTFAELVEQQDALSSSWQPFMPLLRYRILTAGTDRLAEMVSASEGLENKVWKSVRLAQDEQELMAAVKSKRYTATKIQRLFTHILLDFNKTDFAQILEKKINYGRVLGFNHKGAELLKQIKKTGCSDLPLLTNINRELTKADALWLSLQYDVRAADIYHLAGGRDLYQCSDFVQKPYFCAKQSSEFAQNP